MTEIQELLDAVDIELYLDREGVRYRHTHGSSGAQLNIKDCPTCGNGNWKVYLNQASGLGNCFAGDHPRGENFSKWSFIKAHLGSPGNRAVVEHIKHYALEMGWRAARKTSVAVEPTASVTDWQLPESHPIPIGGKSNLKYLENRGIDSRIAEYFHMRMSVRGYYRYKVTGDWHFQDHSNRIILPIHDLDGKLVTFQGRDILGTQNPKYLFPPGLPGTGRFLYNGMNVIGTKRVAIGEGVFDVAALKIAFDEDPALRDVVPIGTFGKHLSSGENSQVSRLEELKTRGIEELTFMWDGEVQATDDALAAALPLMELGFRVRIAMLQPDKDPNEMAASNVRHAFYEARTMGPGVGLKIMLERRQQNALAKQSVVT